MGTWASGPFSNDSALDFVGEVVDKLMEPVDEFMEEPQIDDTFDPAFAAIALLNVVMENTPSRPFRKGKQIDPKPIRKAMLECFDDQIDDLDPDPGYKRGHRAALKSALDKFVKLLS